ncbi:PTS sugar transporter subunit IIA [Paenirhodobacter enshiensis]|jgi:PTS system nitrogen regulatory IIA component|nr:PTS sugar transporter subunit IIA [Paenirhodobacter enshiensis]
MMKITDTLGAGDVLLIDALSVKEELLGLIGAHFAGVTGLERDDIAEALAKRESLGTTGLGDGIAVPHAPIAGLDTACLTFVRLGSPLAFDAVDGAGVDLVCAILFPDSDQPAGLKLLACVARTLRRPDVAKELRKATTADEIITALAIEALPPPTEL